MSAEAVLADRIERLRFNPSDPSAFIGERSALAAELRMLPVPISPRAIRHELPDPLADQRVRRLQVLLHERDRELAKLRRLLAGARVPGRRIGRADTRQMTLPECGLAEAGR